jgi:serine/threonine-protein kinase
VNRYLGEERYELKDRLGHGGMATVFSARDLKLDRQVAIKLLADNFAGDDEVRRRFSREARLAAKLDHPNIVQVYDVGEDDGRPYIGMEQVDGGTLDDRPMAAPDRSPRMRACACSTALRWPRPRACQEARPPRHQASEPVALLRRLSQITDFGIARARRPRLTQAGKVIGTESYMAPEQWPTARSRRLRTSTPAASLPTRCAAPST